MRVEIDAIIQVCVQIAHEMHAAAERAATNVEQRMRSGKTVLLEEFQLERANLVPGAADKGAVIVWRRQ